jgi:Sensory domain found in PocR
LSDTAVPIRIGEKTVGFLQAGQLALEEAPSEAAFTRVSQQITEWGLQIDLAGLREAYLHSQVLSQNQHAGIVRLLEIFAQHRSLVANEIALREAQAESPLRRARAYIAGHHEDTVRLEEVAKAMHVSTFYFCKRPSRSFRFLTAVPAFVSGIPIPQHLSQSSDPCVVPLLPLAYRRPRL